MPLFLRQTLVLLSVYSPLIANSAIHSNLTLKLRGRSLQGGACKVKGETECNNIPCCQWDDGKCMPDTETVSCDGNGEVDDSGDEGGEDCQDSKSERVKGRKKCSWVAKDPSSRCKFKKAKLFCKSICGTCGDNGDGSEEGSGGVKFCKGKNIGETECGNMACCQWDDGQCVLDTETESCDGSGKPGKGDDAGAVSNGGGADSDGDCQDDAVLKKGKGKKNWCSWVAKKASARCKSKKAKSMCKKTCGACDDDKDNDGDKGGICWAEKYGEAECNNISCCQWDDGKCSYAAGKDGCSK